MKRQNILWPMRTALDTSLRAWVTLLSTLFLLGAAYPLRTLAEGFSYTVELQVPGDHREALEKNLELMRWRDNPRMTQEQLGGLVGRAEAEVRMIMETRGYYSPLVRVSQHSSGDRPAVVIRVEPGEPLRVSQVELDFCGELGNSRELSTPRMDFLREQWSLKAGEPFSNAAWESAKHSALRDLVIRSYPEARIRSSQARLDPQTREAVLSVMIDSGPRYQFGALEIIGLSRYPQSVIERLNPIKPGDEYSQSALLTLRSLLQDTGYFETVLVEAETTGVLPEAVPITVMVTEKQARRVGFGLGLSTDAGVRGQIEYQDNNFIGDGRRLTSVAKADIKEQKLNLNMDSPIDVDGSRNSVLGEYALTDIEGTENEKLGLGARHSWTSDHAEHILGLDFKTEIQRPNAASRESSHALEPRYTWVWRDVDSPIMPQRGHILRLELGAATEAILSSRDFVRGYGKWIGFVPLGGKTTLILRAELGAVISGSRRGVPSDYLFRTGGDQSVRGYAYQSLGVPVGAGITGGRVLGVASAEVVRWLKPKWGAALFYDSGDAADSWRDFSARQGYGAGARWRSPVGPVNLDIAYGQEAREIRLHFSLGVAF